MKEKPIIFSAPMVKAILEWRKSQTRRVVKPQPNGGPEAEMVDLDGAWGLLDGDLSGLWKCPYPVGTIMWVRETHWQYANRKEVAGYGDMNAEDFYHEVKKVPSIFMPRWASRINLEVTDVRVERLQSITNEEAQAEGARWKDFGCNQYNQQMIGWSMEEPFPERWGLCLNTARYAFANYINKIHGGKNWNLKPSNLWEENPWVWVISFQRTI